MRTPLVSAALAAAGAMCIATASAQPIILNPSFEANGGTYAAPGYVATNPVLGWTGTENSWGRNKQNNAFYDNGIHPHGDSALLIQSPTGGSMSNTVSQSVDGFETGKAYTLEFSYNARASGAAPNLEVTVGGTSVFGPLTAIAPVEAQGNFTTAWNTASVSVASPGDGAFDLAFINDAGNGGTVLIDDVRLYETNPAAPVVANAGFEVPAAGSFPSDIDGASSAATPAGQGRVGIASWSITPGDSIVRTGVGPTSPFVDNGAVPEGSQVAFFQNNTHVIDQTVPGFQAATQYQVAIRANTRAGAPTPARVEVTIDGTSVISTGDIPVAGGTNAYASYTGTYTPGTSGPKVVTIANATNSSGLMIDDLKIIEFAPGDIALPETSVEAGTVPATFSDTITFVIDNEGADDLEVTGFNITGPDSGAFSVISPATPFTISGLADQTVTVQFAPSAEGAASATLEISSDDGDEPTVNVALSGTGAPSVPYVENGDFALPLRSAVGDPGYTTNIPGWTASGSNVGVDVQGPFFWDNGSIPAAAGNQVGFVQGPNSLTQSVNGFTASEEYFVRAYINARTIQTATAQVSVTLGGTQLFDTPTTISAVAAASDFSVPFYEVIDYYTAASTGAEDLVLAHLVGQDTFLIGSVEILPVSSNPADIDVPSSATLASVAPSTTGQATTTISNTGLGRLSITDLQISGTDSGLFSLVGPPTLPAEIVGLQELELTVEFAGSASTGSYTASLDITSDDGDEATVSVPLSISVISSIPDWVLLQD